MTKNVLFDNFIITHDEKVASDYAKETFTLKNKREKIKQPPKPTVNGESLIQQVMDFINKYPVPIFTTLALLLISIPILFYVGCSMANGPKKEKKEKKEIKLEENKTGEKKTEKTKVEEKNVEEEKKVEEEEKKVEEKKVEEQIEEKIKEKETKKEEEKKEIKVEEKKENKKGNKKGKKRRFTKS